MTTTKERVAALSADMETLELPADDPAVESMLMAFRDKFGLGPRDQAHERATTWRGVKYKGTTVAVFGEYLEGKRLEVTDAYYDGTLEGKIAFASMLYSYREMLNRGDIDQIAHVALYENREHWHAIVRETGDEPHALVFLHKRKDVPK
jgi:hypothetical protein